MKKKDDHQEQKPDAAAQGLTISQRKIRAANQIVRAVYARREGEQELGYCAREFTLCSLPYKQPKKLVYERKNGSFTLKVIGHPEYGLPYGQDRLIPIWLATAFQASGCPEDNIIRVRFASDILRALGLSLYDIGGNDLQRLRARFERVFGATYFVRNSSFPSEVWQEEGYRLIRRVALWFDQKRPRNQHSSWQNQIQLSTEFANDLRKASIPIDLNTIRALKETPAALDLYIWQAWRSYRLARLKEEGPVSIPVLEPEGLLWQLGTSVAEPRKAKQLLRRWQQLVKLAWPECPNQLSKDGELFLLRPALAVQKDAKLKLPGVQKYPPRPLPPPQQRPDLFLGEEQEEPQEEPPSE